MATEIEILAVSTVSVTAAFYFPVSVNDRIAGADNPSRTAAGNLAGQDLTDLRSGALHEIVETHKTGNATRAQIGSKLVARRAELAGTFLAHYTAAHDRQEDVGKVHDGAVWS